MIVWTLLRSRRWSRTQIIINLGSKLGCVLPGACTIKLFFGSSVRFVGCSEKNCRQKFLAKFHYKTLRKIFRFWQFLSAPFLLWKIRQICQISQSKKAGDNMPNNFLMSYSELLFGEIFFGSSAKYVERSEKRFSRPWSDNTPVGNFMKLLRP